MSNKDEIFELIKKERERQEKTLALIPSENYASSAVREAVGSVLMNKYAEGQVGKRYYQGNSVADEVEATAIARALKVFGLDGMVWSVNVQPHSGSPANLAVYNALLEPGDKILSMFLPDGGHLSHGWQAGGKKISIVSNFYEVEFYKTDEKTRVLDYAAILDKAKKFKPKMIVSGGTAYPREIEHERMRKIASEVGAYYLADVSHEAGLIAAGVCQSPFNYADVVTMTTHKTLRGPRGAMIFSRRDRFLGDQVMSKKLDEVEEGEQIKMGEDKVSVADAVDKSVFPGLQGGPHLHTIAGIAVALAEADTDEFKEYAQQVLDNALVLAVELTKAGFDVVSGGTDKHLVLVDLRDKGLSGWTLAWALEACGIIANRNTVPGETASPFYPSGLRLGTPAVTTRGLGADEMKKIAGWIAEVAEVVADKKIPDDKKERQEFVREFLEWLPGQKRLGEIKKEVKALVKKYPLD